MYYDSGRKKGIIFWLVVVIIVVGLINTPFFKRIKIINAAKTFAANVSYPFKYAASGIWNGTTYTATNFFRIKGVQRENILLKAELSEAKAKLVISERLETENKTLRDMLAFRARYFTGHLTPAEIIGRSASNWFEVIEINRGIIDKILPDMAVINEEGLVGRVFEVSQFTSKVLLITDPTSAVSIIDSNSGDMAIATGNSIGPVSIKYMPATADIKSGDKIFTSGMSDIFPKGIIVGYITSVSKKDHDIFQKIEVKPSVNFSKLDKLFVVVR
jgi:rod shape-determining protein MreC